MEQGNGSPDHPFRWGSGDMISHIGSDSIHGCTSLAWISSGPPFEIFVSIQCFPPITIRFGYAYVAIGDISTLTVGNSTLGIAPFRSTIAEMIAGTCMGGHEHHGTKDERQDTACVQLDGDGPGGRRRSLDRLFHLHFSSSGSIPDTTLNVPAPAPPATVIHCPRPPNSSPPGSSACALRVRASSTGRVRCTSPSGASRSLAVQPGGDDHFRIDVRCVDQA